MMKLKGMDKIKQYVNVNELVFDGMILIMIFFLEGLIIPEGKSVLDFFQQESALILVLGIEFFAIIYLGMIYRSYYEEVSDRVMNLIFFVFFLVINGLFVGIILALELYKIVPLQNLFEVSSDARVFSIGVLSYTLLLAGIISFPLNEEKRLRYIFYIPGMISIFIILFFSPYIIFTQARWYIGLILLVGSIGLMVLALILKHKLENRKKQLSSFVKNISKWGKNVILPAITSFFLVLWNDLYMFTMTKSSLAVYGKINYQYIMLSFVISGLIPLRLIENLAPPYKPVNTVLAIVTFVIYILELLENFVDFPK